MIYETVLAKHGEDAEATDRMQGVVYKQGFTIDGDTLVKYKGKDQDIVIPDGIRVIGPSAFAGNPFARRIVIPEGVTILSRWAFYYCTSLRQIVIPKSVRSIGEEAFRICRMLESVELPEGLETIEQLTFSGCAFLRNVSMPASVSFLGPRAFWGCKRLESVTLGGREIPPALLNNEFRPPLRADEPFPAPSGHASDRTTPPEIHVAWRAWLAAACDSASAPAAAACASLTADTSGLTAAAKPEKHTAAMALCGQAPCLDAQGRGFDVLDAPCRAYLRDHGDNVCAALGYDAETLKFIARNRLISKEAALRAAAQCSERGYVEATALLMELAQGLAKDDGLEL